MSTGWSAANAEGAIATIPVTSTDSKKKELTALVFIVYYCRMGFKNLAIFILNRYLLHLQKEYSIQYLQIRSQQT